MLSLIATTFFCAVLCTNAARADQNDAMVQVPPKRFDKSVAHAEQIKSAVEEVQKRTKAASEAAVAVKDRFAEYQGTLRDLKGQLHSIDVATHAFEGELFDHLASEEPARLGPFEEYSPEFGHVEISHGRNASAKRASVAPALASSPLEHVNATTQHQNESEASFLQDGSHASKDADFQSSRRVSIMMKSGSQAVAEAMQVAQNDTGAPARFKDSSAHAEEIKVAAGKVKDKVELAKQAAAKVQQNLGEYRGKITDIKTQFDEVNKEQHLYNGRLLDHFEGEEDGRMKAFEGIQSNMLRPAADAPNATHASSSLANGTALLQA